MACSEATEAILQGKEPNSGDRKAETTERREFPVETTVLLFAEPKKERLRDRKLDGERRYQKRKKRFEVSRRATTHRAKLNRQKEKFVGETATGPWLSEQSKNLGHSGRI
jgi:hypothetical protein